MKGKRILVVEDEPALREFLAMIIEDTGATVVSVDTAEEGIRQLDKQPWAAVVTDVRTPGLSDGWGLDGLRKMAALACDRDQWRAQ